MIHNYDELRLSIACEDGDLEKIKSLIEEGVDIDSKSDNWTPLMWASLNGNLEIVEYLVENGANIDNKGDYGWTALMYASWNNRLKILKCLIENGANLNEKDKHGNTALILASSNEHLEVAKYLVENGADVNIKNNKGETALMIALISYIKIFKFKENKPDAKIIINSILAKCLEIVKFLIKNKAHVNIVNNEGKTALDLAEENGCKDVAEFLRIFDARNGNEMK